MRARVLLPLTTCLALAATSSPVAGQTALPRGPWVPTWTVVYGGFRQVEGLAAADGLAWGVDYSVVSQPTGNLGQTAFVQVVDGVWRAAQVDTGPRLQAIDLFAADRGMAVGLAGAIYRYDGRLWTAMFSPTRQELTDVVLVSEGEGWAVGERATALHWDGRGWDIEDLPIEGSRLTAVAVSAPGRPWVTSLGGQILHLDGESWSVADAPLLERGADIEFARADYGMAIGSNVLLYDGRWRQIEGPARTHQSLAFLQDTAYVVGDSALYRYPPGGPWEQVRLDGLTPDVSSQKWTRLAAAPDGVWALAGDGTVVLLGPQEARFVRPALREAYALDMVDTELGWAGGLAATAAFVGSGPAGGPWTRAHAAPEGTVVRAIDLHDATDGWAVGADPIGQDAHMWRWDGTDWQDWPIEKTWEIADIEVLGPDDAWASKGNVIARFDGTDWRQVTGVPVNASLGGLAMLRGGAEPEGWFGSYGGMYHLQGDVWTPITLSTRSLIVDIEVPDQREGWAIDEHTLYRYDGTDWLEVELPLRPTSVLYDVDAPERDNAWILADPDGLYHWNGGSWEQHDLGPLGDAFEAVRIQALRLEPASLSTDVWLVGRNPSIGRYRVVTPVGTVFLPSVRTGRGG